MFKKFFKTKFHLRFILNPYIRYKSSFAGSLSGINQVLRKVPIIVSLTSYEERFKDLELSLYSLINQTIKPDRIILWLSDEYNLSDIPYSITKYVKNGLEIRFVKDIRSYTKIIYALKEFPYAINISADDDIYYPKDWLEKLYLSYIACPDDIHVHRAHRVKYMYGHLLPYNEWTKHVEEESARYDNFLTGVGGVLYPPDCFTADVFREDIFLKYAPFADDIWFWLMAVVSDRKIRVVQNHCRTLTCTDIFSHIGLYKRRSLYSINKFGENDKQLKELLKFYGSNVFPKLSR